MKIYIGADHNGYKLKEYIFSFFSNTEFECIDCGADKFDKTDDYPDYAKKVSQKVAKDSSARGILLCGSGVGMCIAANRYKKIRAVNAWNTKIARQSRKDDDTNILCLPALHLTRKEAIKIIHVWFKTKFSQEKRHRRRLSKLMK